MATRAPGRFNGGSPSDDVSSDGVDSGVYRLMVEALSEAVLLYGADNRVLMHNSSAERLLGLSAAQLKGQAPPPPGWCLVREGGGELPGIAALRHGEPQRDVVLRVQTPEGARWLCTNAEPLFQDGDSRPYAAVVSLTDITERRRTQEQLERQSAFRGSLIALVAGSLQRGLDKAFYQHLLEGAVRVIPGAQAGSLLLRGEGEAFHFVAAVNFDREVLGRVQLYEHELFRDPAVPGLQLIYGFDNSGIEPERRAPLYEAGDTDRIKVSMSIPVEMGGRAIAYFNLDNFDDPNAFDEEAIEMGRIFAHQVAALWQRLQLEAELREERRALKHLAFFDPLTGLPNRALLQDRLQHALSQRTTDALAVMFVDLDNFKDVNDTLGHDAGDALLCEVSRRLEGCVRVGDTVARWGGDEFVLLLPGVGEEVATRIARKILARLSHPFTLLDVDVHVGASLGIALYPGLATKGEDLLKHADIALYRAKEGGKNTYQVFTEDMNRRLQVRLSQGAELREALASGALSLSFEPRVNLVTLEVTAVEAKLVWPHPERGPLRADTLLPLAEEAGLVGQLSERTIALACEQAALWVRESSAQRLCLTLCSRGLRRAGLVQQLEHALRRAELEPAQLELGIGDLATVESPSGLATLRALHRLGVHLSLASLGVPGIPLNLLRQLPLSSVQLDPSFTDDLTLEKNGDAREQARNLIQLVVALGRSLGITVVARGITTPPQHALLRELGCHEGQGPLFHPLQPAPSGAAAGAFISLPI
jgi:diguanylate cyclase (GGDEF)-like protein/PAS domain S-box-containing protein